MTIISTAVDPSLADDFQPFEIVERKGLGHPDTLCDRISELTSVLYCRFCLESFGRVAHHWFDKVMLIGGEADIAFGAGRLTAPYEVILAGKAVTQVGDVDVPLDEIFRQAAVTVLTQTLKNFDPAKDLVVTNRVRSGRGPGQPKSRYRPDSPSDLEQPESVTLVSNDCNLCTGYFPLSTLEQMVLGVDEFLLQGPNSQRLPYVGSDIKTVGWRRGGEYSLVVNVPFMATAVSSHDDYMDKCEHVEKCILDWVVLNWGVAAEVRLNPERVWKRAYLTVTGTVADTGDVGVTGRGNRMNGLITPGREMSIEATAGKNPLDHTGKLYNALAAEIAREVSTSLGAPCKVGISTTKGALLSCPSSVTVVLAPQARPQDQLQSFVTSTVERALERVPFISNKFIKGDVIRVC